MRKGFLCLGVLGFFVVSAVQAKPQVPRPNISIGSPHFIVHDPDRRLSVSEGCVRFSGLDVRKSDTYAYVPYFAPAAFTHTFDAVISQSGKDAGELLVWGLSDTPDKNVALWNNGIYLGFYNNNGDLQVELDQYRNGQWSKLAQSTVVEIGKRYYFTVARKGAIVTVHVHLDSQRKRLLKTFEGRTEINEPTRYLYGISSWVNGQSHKIMSGEVCGWGTGEGVAEVGAVPAERGRGTGWQAIPAVLGGAVIHAMDFLLGAEPAHAQVVEEIFISDVDYNAAGQIARVAYGNGVVTDYSYDPENLRLTRLKSTDPQSTIIQDFQYTYDGVGNIVEIQDAVHTAGQTFAYDALNRLTTATGDGYGSKNYQYDEIGNIIQKDGLTYTYGQNGAGPHAVTSLSDGAVFQYDANGNMTVRQQGGVMTEYLYDAENRLVEVRRDSELAAKFEYDGDGGRTKKILYDNGAMTKEFVFVGALYEETDGAGTNFIYLGDQRVAAAGNSEASFYHGDHLGGTNVVTDWGGVIKEVVEYEPYGQFTRHDDYSAGQSVEHYFTGQRLDDEVGLYYYGARYYDAGLGRFITADTVVPNPNNPQEFNRYSYVLNNPVNRVDPSGHFSLKKFFKQLAGAVIGTVVGIATGQPWLGFSAYNAFTAGLEGGNIGAAIGGAVVGYFGGGVLGETFGNFWGVLGGGALGGAAGAGMGGGNVGLAALSGLGSSWSGYTVGAMTGLAGLGTIIGGGVGSEISGGDFGEGALGGLTYNIGFTLGSTVASWQYSPKDTALIPEDSQVFFAGPRIGKESSGWLGKLYSIGMAIFDPGPFNHTGIGAGNGEVVDSHPDVGDLSGPGVRSVRTFGGYSDRDRIFTIQRKAGLANAARSLAADLHSNGVRFGGMPLTGSDGIYCSKFAAQARTKAGEVGVYGTGPNSQYWFSK
ncbi:MAG: RHS repeat-associated core domain-containing protein [Candidatus Doudnabacteria bacterium]|nr:RHS repeat-associated core domain-containing protein [Candidatus Omnitrophota bacterium]MDZ4243985.1 RHS repeat-associated core domain-containing protein [Candidatus Doudnabacteria bacterium]